MSFPRKRLHPRGPTPDRPGRLPGESLAARWERGGSSNPTLWMIWPELQPRGVVPNGFPREAGMGGAIAFFGMRWPQPSRQEGGGWSTDTQKRYAECFTHGPFPPSSTGEHLTQRVPIRILDQAPESGLRVFIHIPCEKHRRFFEDWDVQEPAQDRRPSDGPLLGQPSGGAWHVTDLRECGRTAAAVGRQESSCGNESV
jgi:hypothetical protein